MRDPYMVDDVRWKRANHGRIDCKLLPADLPDVPVNDRNDPLWAPLTRIHRARLLGNTNVLH